MNYVEINNIDDLYACIHDYNILGKCIEKYLEKTKCYCSEEQLEEIKDQIKLIDNTADRKSMFSRQI